MFTGDLTKTTYAQLLAFLGQSLPEGKRLDYKQAFPSNLEKAIAAMANTEGGLILIGVAEDESRPRYPVVPPLGIPTEQAVERVVSKAYQSIRDPLTPEVHAIPFDGEPAKCVVAIRVQPSDRAPHAVGQGTDIYVRVDSQSLPENLEARMGIDRIEWLLRRREQNSRLLQVARERAAEVLEHRGEIATGSIRVDITIQPTLAHAEPLSIATLTALAARPSRNGYQKQYPDDNLRVVAGGLVTPRPPRETYVDVTGLCAYSRLIPYGRMGNVTPAPENVLYPQWLSALILQIHWAGVSARDSGRGGFLVATVELRGIREVALLFGNHGWDAFEADEHRALQNTVSSELRFSAEEAASDPLSVGLRLLALSAQAFGWNATALDLGRRYPSERFAPA